MAILKRTFLLFMARNREFYRDTEALAWNFIFPILILLGFGFMFKDGSQKEFKVAVVKSELTTSDPALQNFLSTKYIEFVDTDALEPTLKKLRQHRFDLVLSKTNPPHYWINESSPKGYFVEKFLQGSYSQNANHLPIVRDAVTGKEIRYVDWLVAGILAMNMMFSALFGVGYNLVRYRKTGVLKRLKATPLKSFEFLFTQLLSRYFLIISVTSIVFIGTNLILHFQMLGSYFDLFIMLSAGAFCLMSVGLLVASRTSSEELSGGLLNLLSWPMMFLSGVWFSLEGAHPYFQAFAKLFPLTHIIEGSRKIMNEGAGLLEVLPQLEAIGVMTLVFFMLGSILFKWE